VDLAGPVGTRIKATSDGKVSFTGYRGAYGNMVEVSHDFGFATRYGHLSKILVKDGQSVKKGDIIAVQGSTGRSTGNHLHYEVRYEGKALNPSNFLKAGDYVR
jgi:murein DD-endopeptidase MepM/ murein hydrolase activator NlpD